MNTSAHQWIIDAMDATTAQIEADGDQVLQIPRALLPEDAHEGDVLAVSHRRDRERSTLELMLDPAASAAALERSRQQMQQPHGKDRGGNIKL
jgi:hypothetical protein